MENYIIFIILLFGFCWWIEAEEAVGIKPVKTAHMAGAPWVNFCKETPRTTHSWGDVVKYIPRSSDHIGSFLLIKNS